MASAEHLLDGTDRVGQSNGHLRDTRGSVFPQVIAIVSDKIPLRHVLPDKLYIITLDPETVLGRNLLGTTAHYFFEGDIILHAPA